MRLVASGTAPSSSQEEVGSDRLNENLGTGNTYY